MEFQYWIYSVLHSLTEVFPIEEALTLGIIFFALSWVRPRSIVALPSNSRRASTLTLLGIAGSLVILAVAAITSWYSRIYAYPDHTGFSGWWLRPGPLAALLVVLMITAFALRMEPLPSPGERMITPRRRFWIFTTTGLLWATVAAVALLGATALWHTLIGVSAPADANQYGIVPEQSTLPIYMSMQQGMGFVSGAGWPNHLATLVLVALTVAAAAWLLGTDANRPSSTQNSTVSVREERGATARLLMWIVLGAVLLTLGAVWAHIGFRGAITVGVLAETRGPGTPETYSIRTGYGDIAELMHIGGYVIQGLGAALLLRLAVDTARAAQARRVTNRLAAAQQLASTK